ncbi:LysR family transcriptional regulator [Lactobacillaceae bacterium Melli_B4]
MINFTLKQLQYFLKLAQTLNYSQAAKQLLISQPALSKQIHELEKILGVKLFDKNGRNITLSNAGAELVGQSANVLNDADALLKSMDNYNDQRMNYLKLGISGNQNIYHVIDHYNQSDNHVHIQMQELSTSEIISQLQSNRLDAGITILPVNNPLVSSKTLFEDELVGIVATNNPRFKNVKSMSVKAFTQFEMVGLNYKFYLRQLLNQAFRERMVMPKYNFEFSDLDSCMNLVRNNSLVGIVPMSILNISNKYHDLKSIQFEDPLPMVTNRLIYLKSQKVNPVVEKLIQSIKK